MIKKKNRSPQSDFYKSTYLVIKIIPKMKDFCKFLYNKYREDKAASKFAVFATALLMGIIFCGIGGLIYFGAPPVVELTSVIVQKLDSLHLLLLGLMGVISYFKYKKALLINFDDK